MYLSRKVKIHDAKVKIDTNIRETTLKRKMIRHSYEKLKFQSIKYKKMDLRILIVTNITLSHNVSNLISNLTIVTGLLRNNVIFPSLQYHSNKQIRTNMNIHVFHMYLT